MIDIALIMMFICAVIGVAFFHNALLPGLVIVFLSSIWLVLRILVSHQKIVLKKNRMIQGGLFLLLVLSFGFQHIEYVENGFLHYQQLLQNFDELLERERPEEAQAVLEKIGELYGTNSNLQTFRRAQLAIYLDQYEEAEKYLKGYDHHSLKEYYQLLEVIYDKLGKTAELNSMYIEAVEHHPEWEYVWSRAGIACMEQKNYQAAHYYLKHAYELAEEDGMAAYRLAILYYTVGEDYQSVQYFVEALEKGVSEETKASMIYYLREMEGSQDES